MSLQSKAIDRLFDRLGVTYGAQFTNFYAGQQPDAVKASWAFELAGFADRLYAIAWALDNLPDRCPNVVEFRKLCRSAPAPIKTLALQAPADPERVAIEVAKLSEVRTEVTASFDARQWARDLQKRGDERIVMLTQFQRAAIREALA